MKTPKPGQFCTIAGVVYRAKKRTNNCTGCALDSFLLCPNIVDHRREKPQLESELNNIVLVRV